MEKDVTRQIEEQLSAFLDGELPEEELALLVRRLERDERHRATLYRYALISGVSRNQGAFMSANSVRQGVMAALGDAQDEPGQPESVPDNARSPAVGYLLAASLVMAVVAVIVANNFTGGTRSDVPVAQVAATQASRAAQPGIDSASVRPVTTGLAVSEPVRARQLRELQRIRLSQERMRSYLISHGEYASPLQGAIADTRMYVQQASFSE